MLPGNIKFELIFSKNESEDSLLFQDALLEDNRKEALIKAELEQAEIVNRYKDSKETNKEERKWANSAFFVYKVTDRFGFLHDKDLPSAFTRDETKMKCLELKRQNKWLKMLSKGPDCVHSAKFHSRVYKGVPLSIRGIAWMKMLGIERLKKNEPDMYDKMKTKALTKSCYIKQIDVDINRTFRDHIMFRSQYSIKQQQLFYVLAAYSVFNSEVGYCQGMSQITALLLMFMNEEDSFWALHSLFFSRKHSMHGFFKPGFPKLFRFQDHHDKILLKFLPGLKKHLDKLGFSSTLYTLKWFFQCFLDRTPFRLTLRLWDVYLLEGEKILVSMAYTTMKVHYATLMKMSIDKAANFFQRELAVDFGFSDDIIIECLKANMNELKRHKMDLPPPPSDEEAPKIVPGSEFEPTWEQKLGIRSSPVIDMAEKRMSVAGAKKIKDATLGKKSTLKVFNAFSKSNQLTSEKQQKIKEIPEKDDLLDYEDDFFSVVNPSTKTSHSNQSQPSNQDQTNFSDIPHTSTGFRNIFAFGLLPESSGILPI